MKQKAINQITKGFDSHCYLVVIQAQKYIYASILLELRGPAGLPTKSHYYIKSNNKNAFILHIIQSTLVKTYQVLI